MESSADLDGIEQFVATGDLPRYEKIESLVKECYDHAKTKSDGEVADHIPELADADPDLFAVCVANTGGDVIGAGDEETRFSIQSISKIFVYALVCEELGHKAVRDSIGVNNTGLPFNSVVAIELNGGSPMNPMVNAGAIAITSMVEGETADDQWDNIRRGLSKFAGRELELDEDVYRSESETNLRNRALGHLMESYGEIDRDPLETVDVYTRQCSLSVTARDLAVMGATLADGGENPLTGEQVVSAEVCRAVLAVMATTGMYERSGDWLFEIGLPAKSGISGGIVAVAPGKGAIGTYAPPLDSAGNSVRGQHATAYLSRALGLNLFASQPFVASTAEDSAEIDA